MDEHPAAVAVRPRQRPFPYAFVGRGGVETAAVGREGKTVDRGLVAVQDADVRTIQVPEGIAAGPRGDEPAAARSEGRRVDLVGVGHEQARIGIRGVLEAPEGDAAGDVGRSGPAHAGEPPPRERDRGRIPDP